MGGGEGSRNPSVPWTQRGAQRLLQLSLPAEVHLDFFLGIVARMGLVEGFMLPQSIVQQRPGHGNECAPVTAFSEGPKHFHGDSVPGTIPHFDLRQVSFRMLLPDVTVEALILTTIVALSCGPTTRRRRGPPLLALLMVFLVRPKWE